MTARRQVTLWCDFDLIDYIELDVEQVSHARSIAKGEGWTRSERHGDLCPRHSMTRSEWLALDRPAPALT